MYLSLCLKRIEPFLREFFLFTSIRKFLNLCIIKYRYDIFF